MSQGEKLISDLSSSVLKTIDKAKELGQDIQSNQKVQEGSTKTKEILIGAKEKVGDIYQ
jgi:hypothetical protein